ncbi:MAG: tetratricopeptide repeat protein [Bradymonadia bacterium]
MSPRSWRLAMARGPLTLCVCWLTLVFSICFTASALAQTPNDPGARAQQLYSEGKALYAEKKYKAAAEKFEAAYAFDPNPVLLFNLARAYEEAGEYQKATQWYEAYLARYQDDKDADAVRHRIHLLKQLIARNKPGTLHIVSLPASTALKFNGVPAPAPTSPGHWSLAPGDYTLEALDAQGQVTWQTKAKIDASAKTEVIFTATLVEPAEPWYSSGTGIGAISLLSVGGLALLGAAFFELQQAGAESDYDDAQSALRSGEGGPEAVSRHESAILTARDDAERFDSWSNVMWIAGGICAAGGTGLLLWSMSDDAPSTAPSGKITVAPNGLFFTGSF